MIDIHSHILPGIDDGPGNIEKTLLMIEQALEKGIHHIIATPHHQTRKYTQEAIEIVEAVNQLNLLMSETGRDMTIYTGQEIRMHGELVQNLKKYIDLPLVCPSGPYVLIELPTDNIPLFTEKVFYHMLTEGYQPIIAHPERNMELIRNPEKLYQFVNQGVMTQLTASSITGSFGRKIQAFSKAIVDANLTHFIASDAHNTTVRNFQLQEAYETIQSRTGTSKYFQQNALSVIQGTPIFLKPPRPVDESNVMTRFRSVLKRV
ncbi:tyrosine-protein phosphatase [Jeotgalibacillus salarius]|uniref:Tyrosine-protein phosphatase n=1 Tax=Jeotgalibacillus salarius TaxID=546023 RepID=A0A4Y8LLU5_9BACL|nr:CpsB/CapC family capsule biosynthesis tyrosine phosphatase [Jeotgalibacillus salarius]TFE04008.1 tyrosine protein phosphatase [Jeotgalibacillus salarius]